MMNQHKTKIKENEENGVGISKRRSTTEVDHWAFLEEIEAPMWADLTLDPNLVTQDSDDAWFDTSHPFHQHSARHLRSAFAHPDAGHDFFNFNLRGVCSPKLPSSVSKSRGKDYRSRDWREKTGISVDKGHPVNELGGRISRSDTGSRQECKPRASCGDKSEGSGSITSLTCNEICSTTVSDNSQVVADDAEARGTLNLQSVSTSGVSSSTITTVSQQQDLKSAEASKQEFGHTGGLLNALKTNLRKSCATRPALRVGICDDRVSKGRKSSSGKSSVGSSSIGYDNRCDQSAVGSQRGHQVHVKEDMNVNIESKGHTSSSGELKKKAVGIFDDRESKGRKSSSGKSSVGSSRTGYDNRLDQSAVGSQRGHQVHVKEYINVNLESTGHKFSSGELEKKAVGLRQNVDRNPNVRERAEPVKGRVNTRKWGEASVRKMTTGSKQNEDGHSKVRDLGKLAQPVKGRVRAKNTGKASVCTLNACNSRVMGRDAASGSTSLEATKSKVLLQDKSSNQLRAQAPGMKSNLGSNRFNGSAGREKENMRRAGSIQRPGGKDNMPVVRVSNRIIPKLKSENKLGKTASVGSKVNIGRADEGKQLMDARVYLR